MKTTDQLNPQETRAFRYQTKIGENGETLYHAPIEIHDQADLDNYGITWKDCRVISFGGTDRRRVFFYDTPSRDLAEDFWRQLNRDHMERVSAKRCMIPGEKKALVRCATANSCDRCPYGRKPADRERNEISLDRMLENMHEPAGFQDEDGSLSGIAGTFHLLLEDLKGIMDAENPVMMDVLRMKHLEGYTAQEIADQLGCPLRRVYTMLLRIRQLTLAYVKDEE